MTGIERLRDLAGTLRENIGDMWLNGRSGPLWLIIINIADQIERERASANSCGTMPQSVSMSACIPLPPDEREDIAWVREHGGLEAVRKMAAITLDVYQRLVDGNAGPEMLETDADTLDSMMAEIDEAIVRRDRERTTATALLDESVPRTAYERHILKRQRQINESHAALRRRNERIAELEQERDELREMIRQLNAQTDEMEKRLMPEGMEWVLWDDGKPVTYDDAPDGVVGVYLALDGSGYALTTDLPGQLMSELSERVKRPAPKVLDADGVEIREGDTVYALPGKWCNRWPCLGIDAYRKMTVETLTNGRNDGSITCGSECLTCYPQPSQLTHRAPVIAADGRPLREGETVWDVDGGGPYEVEGFVGKPLCVMLRSGINHEMPRYPLKLTHERPDSWERLEEDIASGFMDTGETVCDCREEAKDIVRRAKALKERDA